MKKLLLPGVLALVCALTPPVATSALAQPPCASDPSPSNDCPARGVSTTAASFPCYAGQVKGDWYSMNYYLPWQASYATVGHRAGSDVWCFSSAADAEGLGFSRS
jgi:hypothetical protein